MTRHSQGAQTNTNTESPSNAVGIMGIIFLLIVLAIVLWQIMKAPKHCNQAEGVGEPNTKPMAAGMMGGGRAFNIATDEQKEENLPRKLMGGDDKDNLYRSEDITVTNDSLSLKGDLDVDRSIQAKKDLNVSGNAVVQSDLRVHKKIHFGDTNTNDPYHLEKITNGVNNSSLRLTINDDSDESFQIWGTGKQLFNFKANGEFCIGRTCINENHLMALTGQMPVTILSQRTKRRLQDGDRNAVFGNPNRLGWERLYIEPCGVNSAYDKRPCVTADPVKQRHGKDFHV